MSVKIMGEVFDLELPRDEKFILLAYVDHAGHNGENIFPAVLTIAKKTGYGERSVQAITKKLVKRGLLIADGKGPKGTNKWRYPAGRGAIFAGVKKATKKNAEKKQKGVNPTAPEPSLTDTEPSVREGEKTAPLKANQIPQIILFRELTGKYPPKGIQFKVIVLVDKVGDRLGREATCDDLRPFMEEWLSRGYNPTSIKWLEDWAVNGTISNGNGYKKSTQDINNLIDQTLGV